MSLDFVAIDFETANQNRSSVCSVGLVKVSGGTKVDEYYSLINPEDYFHPFNIQIHGISEDMVRDAPTYPKLRDTIIEFMEGLPVVAHNAPFDTGVIRDVNQKYGLDNFEMNYFCSYALSKSLLSLDSYKLNSVAKEFQFEFKHHDALDDAKACAVIVTGLSNKFMTPTVNELIQKAGYKNFGYIGVNGWRGFRKTAAKRYPQSDADIMKQLYYPPKDELDSNHDLYDKNVVFTGTLLSMTRKDAMQHLVNVGGIPQKSITKDTNFLVLGGQEISKLNSKSKSSKWKKAEELANKGQNIQIIGESDFLRMVKLNNPIPSKSKPF